MKLNRVLSFILAVAMIVSFFPGGIFYEDAQATVIETDYEVGYTWKFDKMVEAFGKTNEFKTVYYGNEANTVGIVNHEGYGNAWGNNTSRSLKNGQLTSVITASWDEAGHGVYYQLPAELVAGKAYRVSMNLYAVQEHTPLVNDKSSHITVSFSSEVNAKQEWRISQLEAYHNANAKFSVPAPASLSTQNDNIVSFEFVATQEMVDAGSWMLITFPMEDGKTYILGDTSIKTVNYNYADGYTWQFDNTIAFTNANAHKVMQYGNKANTVGIISHSAYASYGARSLSNGILTTNITSSWAKGANGLYYKLPLGLVAGQEYVVSMNLYASAEATALVNGDSTSIKLSFSNEIPAGVTDKVDQYWTAVQIEGIHYAETLLTYRAPEYLSTDTANKVAISFVATQAMADNDGWMLISMPLAVNGEVNLGDVTLQEKNTDNHFLNGDFSGGLTGWMTNNDSSYVSVQDSALQVSDKVPTGDVKLYQAMYLDAGMYRLSFDVFGVPTSWRPVYFMGTALDNSSVTGAQLQVSKEAGKSESDWWTVTRDVTIATAGTYYFQMNLNQVSNGAAVAPAMQYDNFVIRKGLPVTTQLSNAKLCADIKAVVLGQRYENTVTAIPGYAISKVTVTMDGTEVTDAYNAETGKISISAVTAQLHIQVETVEDETANLLVNGNFEQGDVGWKNNGLAPVATIADGVLTLSTEKTASGDARSYYEMQLKPGAYQLSFDVKGTPQQYRPLISISKNYWTNDYGQYFMYDYNLSETEWTKVTASFIVPESAADANTGLAPIYVTIWSSGDKFAPVTSMQFDNFTVHKGLMVTTELSNAKLSKDIKAVVLGQSYGNTVLPNPGYKVSKVTVTMGGTEVADAYNAETGIINVAAVTAQLHIQVETVEDESANLLVNGSFDQGNTGWKNNDVRPAATITDGVLTLSTEKTASGDARIYNVMELKPGAYQLSFDAKGTPQQYRPLISISKNYWTNDYGQYFMYDYNLSETEWTKVTASFIVPESAADANTGLAPVYVTIWSSNASVAPVTSMQFDNFDVRKGLPVTADLSGAKLSADIKAIVPGQSYVNTVTAIPGYAISKVTVTMGGTEVTDAYDAETGTISVAAVTAQLHIQVETVEDETANLFVNGNFDQGNTGWTSNGIAPVATIANGVLKLSTGKTASGDARIYYATQLKPGNYKLSFKVKGTPQQYRPLISVSKNAWTNDYGQYILYKYNLNNAAWTTVTEYFTVPESAADENTGFAPVCMTIWSSSEKFAPVTQMYFDDFELYKSAHVIVQKPEDSTDTRKPAVIGKRPNPSPYNDYPYICDEAHNLMPNFGFESEKNPLENTYSKIVADENAWEGNHSLHYAPIITADAAGNLLTNGDFAKWDQTGKTISDWQFNNPSKLNKLQFVELDGRNAVKLTACGENEDFNLEMTQRVYLEADFTYTFSFDFYGVAHWGPNLVIYDNNMEHISTMNAKTAGTEGQWTTLSTTYRPTESGYYVFAVRIHNAAYPQKEQYISNCSVTLKSTRVEYELKKLKPDTNYWLTLFVKASEDYSVENSFITFGMTVPKTGNFLLMEDPSSEGGRPYKIGQQLVPMAFDGQWHILSIPFNTKELTELNFTIDGLNCEVWFDNIYIFEESNAKTFQAPTAAKGEAVVTDSNPKLLGCEEDKNLFKNYNLNDGDAFWGENIRKFGAFGNTVKVTDSGSQVYGSALHYVSKRPNDTYYIKWVDVEPDTEYTFSAKYAIATPGEGYMGLINGYRMESEVTENRLFPTMIQRFDFDEENYLESLAWQTAAVTFNSGERNRIGFVICDAGGEAYMDELRLFKASDGIALEDVEDTLLSGQNSADTPVQPEKPGVIAVVLWAAGGVLLAAAMVSLIIIQKKRKNKR